MNQVIQDRYIPQQILYFIAGRRCCQQFACTFRESENETFQKCAKRMGLRSLYTCKDGQGCLSVYKRQCKHYMDEPKILTLSPTSVADMFTMLCHTRFVGSVDDLLASADYVGKRHNSVTVPPLSLTLPELKQPHLRTNTQKQFEFIMNFPGLKDVQDVFKAVYGNRVVVYSADLCWDKSLYLPILFFEDCSAKGTNLKIFCVEKEDILAVYNSERSAKYFNENVGQTVGLQLRHHNNISSSTHIIYTTAKYFLRYLISEKGPRKLRNISHVFLNDVHMHEIYHDILLTELRRALNIEQNLRIILLSQGADPQQFLQYFNEGIDVLMDKTDLSEPRIVYLDEIHNIVELAAIRKGPEIAYKEQAQMFRNKSPRNKQMDSCLEAYEDTGSDTSFKLFLYAVNYELMPVNYQHSLTGKTATIITCQLNKPKHLRLLLLLGADPYVPDVLQQNAVTLAVSKNYAECVDLLNNYSLHGYALKNTKPEYVDFDLIINIMYLLFTKPEYASGNIFIIVPSFYHIVKLNYMLLSHSLTGYLPDFFIYQLHSNMKKEYLDALIAAPSQSVKVVLTTNIIESLPLPMVFKYVIDTACEKHKIYDYNSFAFEETYEWIAHDRQLRRDRILLGGTESVCFRLLSNNTYAQLNPTSKPELQKAQLDKICLMVKLLSPHSVIGEYMSLTIAPPSQLALHHTVQFLKKIDVLDEMEDVTWLGCRLLDLPVSCQLGRTLIFGILLQCLDPILTIVSSLLTTDPLTLPSNYEIDNLWTPFTVYIQNRIKSERVRLAENQLSDHLMFVRQFQEWEKRFTNNMPPVYLTDEYEFILNCLMEEVSVIRSNIVNALRAANLVHCHGQLNIQSLNQHSDKWGTVKAALTAGMYPNICVVDTQRDALKSSNAINIHLCPHTVLRQFLEPLDVCAKKFKSPWIMCTQFQNYVTYATVVVPIAVALFAGSRKLRCEQLVVYKSTVNGENALLFIDEWIWMLMPKPVAELVLKTRQFCFSAYQKLLKHCSNPEMFRADSPLLDQRLINALSTIFENEELASGFTKCTNTGYLPALKLPNLYLLSINAQLNCKQKIYDMKESKFNLNLQFVERHFFLLYTKDPPISNNRSLNKTFIENVVGKLSNSCRSTNRHIYIILYGKNPDAMYSVSTASYVEDKFILKELFRNKIPINELFESFASLNVTLPTFDERVRLAIIDHRVGNIITDLFAFRNHWVYQN